MLFLGRPAHHRVLAVVKKNPYRLRNFLEWLGEASDAVLRACPVLIIDDEADQASVNTARVGADPSRINGLIRDILHALPKAAYVGYTATPFANALIDPGEHNDIYPRHFILDPPLTGELFRSRGDLRAIACSA